MLMPGAVFGRGDESFVGQGRGIVLCWQALRACNKCQSVVSQNSKS